MNRICSAVFMGSIILFLFSCSEKKINIYMNIKAKVIDRTTQLALPNYELIFSYYKYLPGSMYGKIKEYQIEYIETDSLGNFEHSCSVAKDKD